MRKRILVIGAGVAQKDAIVRTKKLGYEVCASDGSPHALGLKEANLSKIIDVKDVASNLAWAKKLRVEGVISYASDIALPTVLSIRETLGLPGLGRNPMEISLDKGRQRTLFQQANS